ncbi:uncharacterized [Lates japonicus]
MVHLGHSGAFYPRRSCDENHTERRILALPTDSPSDSRGLSHHNITRAFQPVLTHTVAAPLSWNWPTLNGTTVPCHKDDMKC